ncbi:hypothetical protein UCRPC4_g01864 [Phaeomoniella chlamydospora]|uniref:Uncharacterized protein n=1 Tax=Phaeomoniella chlamydospora TaxID=158046 RepID=A0A0G2H9V9_PHACM|nr:hypothetical protein UCRPC4_g01864 [Phaeomoniella chlamydospora]
MPTQGKTAKGKSSKQAEKKSQKGGDKPNKETGKTSSNELGKKRFANLSGRLYLAIYNPRPGEGNVLHWALFLDCRSTNTWIVEVAGGPRQWRRSILTGTRPSRTASHRRNEYLADIDDVDSFLSEVHQTTINNSVVLWNCQQYVMDILDRLNNEDLIDDYQYADIRDRLQSQIDRGASSERD